MKSAIKKLLGLRDYERIAPRVLSAFNLGKYPDFLIIGQQKCGTTSLYRALCEHAEVKASLTKQSHYFDRSYRLGSAYYKAHFIGSKKMGEATPDYFDHPEALNRIQSEALKVPMLLLLRDPLERAWSHYRMSKRLGYEKRSFQKALELEDNRLKTDDFAIEHFGYRYKSDYLEHFKAWKNVYGDALLCLDITDLEKKDALDRIQEHFGLSKQELHLKRLNSFSDSSPINIDANWLEVFGKLKENYLKIIQNGAI